MTCAQVRRGDREGAAVAVHPDGRERARRAREVMRAVAASRPVYGRTTGVRANRSVTADDAGPGATDGERTARFQTDVIPLLEPLYHHAAPMTRNHAAVEDLLQETTVKAYAGFRTFQPWGAFTAWLHRILLNTYISCHRKHQRRHPAYVTDAITDAQLAANGPYITFGPRSAEEEEALNTLPTMTSASQCKHYPLHLSTRKHPRSRGTGELIGGRQS